MNQKEYLYDIVCKLQSKLIDYATYRKGNVEEEYAELRSLIMKNQGLRRYVPSFVSDCRDLDHFWGFIKEKFSTYAERKKYIGDEFASLLNYIEFELEENHTGENCIELKNSTSEEIKEHFLKATQKCESDPTGAITNARSLLEAVVKHLLDEYEENYLDKDELPDLYKKLSKKMNLAPEQHQEQIFKETLSGLISTVKGLGSLRNKLGDAHGKGKNAKKPLPRHSRLVVGVASTLANFLLETFEAKKEKEILEN